MEGTVPVTDLSPSNVERWQSIFESFKANKNAKAGINSLRRLFSSDAPGLCASVLILNSVMQSEEHLANEEVKINTAILVRCCAKYLFELICKRQVSENIAEVFGACKERLSTLFLSECGCFDCARTVKALKPASTFSRLPKINPHTKHTYDSLLAKLYNAIVLCHNAYLDFNLLTTIITETSYESFSDEEVNKEAELLTICLIYCWIFLLLESSILGHYEVVFEPMLEFAERFKLPTKELHELEQLEFKLLAKLAAGCTDGEFAIHYPVNFEYPIVTRSELCKNRLHKEISKHDQYESFCKMIEHKASSNIAPLITCSAGQLNDVALKEETETSHSDTFSTSPLESSLDSLPTSPVSQKQKLPSISEADKDLPTLSSLRDWQLDDAALDDFEIFDDVDDFAESYLPLNMFEQKMYESVVEPVIYKETYIPLGAEERATKRGVKLASSTNKKKEKDPYYRDFV